MFNKKNEEVEEEVVEIETISKLAEKEKAVAATVAEAPEEKTIEFEYEDDEIDVNDPVGMGDFVLSIFLTAIPVVNIICLIVWIASKNTKPSKKNWAKAKLIWVLIGTVLGMVVLAFTVGLLAAVGSSLG